jgi:hypothetical protein
MPHVIDVLSAVDGRGGNDRPVELRELVRRYVAAALVAAFSLRSACP